MNGRRMALVLLLAAAPGVVVAQEANVEARLVARGLPQDLVRQVAAIAADAVQRGVPSGPLADKAIEGWAKQVGPERIVTAVRAFEQRLEQARAAVAEAGMESPPGAVIGAAAEAMQGGLDTVNVRAVVGAAPTPAAASSALTVAATLAEQGLGGGQASAIVVKALKNHQSMSQLLNMPSLARAMHAEGMTPEEIGRQMMDGADQGARLGAPHGERPSGVPPGMGRNQPHPPRTPGHPCGGGPGRGRRPRSPRPRLP